MEHILCPACLMKDKLGVIYKTRGAQKCYQCNTAFPKNATLISEDALRMHVRESDKDLEYLLKDLDDVGRLDKWYRRRK